MQGEWQDLEAKVNEAIEELKKKSAISRLLIGLSGGKDSLCLCELVKMAGITNVRYFFMEFLPNLRIQDELLAYPITRFNIPEDSIIRVPSEHFMKCMHGSIYTWYSPEAKKQFPSVSRMQVFKAIAKEHKGTVVVGVKKSDGLMMQRLVNGNKGICVYPLREWTLNDVLTFMKIRKISLPPLTLKGCRGVGLTPESSALFIYENYPDDWKKIERIFPFAGAIIYKYKYYDIHRSMRIV